jgi:hypothetical protein
MVLAEIGIPAKHLEEIRIVTTAFPDSETEIEKTVLGTV